MELYCQYIFEFSFIYFDYSHVIVLYSANYYNCIFIIDNSNSFCFTYIKPVRLSRTIFRQFKTFSGFQIDSNVLMSDNSGSLTLPIKSQKTVNTLLVDRIDFNKTVEES